MPPNDQNFPIQLFAFPSPEGINSGTVINWPAHGTRFT
jgi:hypothetical protein